MFANAMQRYVLCVCVCLMFILKTFDLPFVLMALSDQTVDLLNGNRRQMAHVYGRISISISVLIIQTP